MTEGIIRDWFVWDWDASARPEVGRVCFLAPGLPSGPSPHGWDLWANTGDGRFYAWNAESGELVYSNKLAARVEVTLPVANHEKLILLDWRDRISSYIYLQTHQTDLLEEHGMVNPTGMPISPDGRLFACITTNGWVKVWDLTTKQSKSIVKLPAFTYVQIAFSPDSRLLAAAKPGGWAQVWNVGTGRLVTHLRAGYLSGTVKVSFSADSKSLVTYGVDYTAKIWNIATGREVISGLPLNRFLTQHPAWTLLPPDGNSVVETAGEAAIRVVRLPTLAQIDALENRQTSNRRP